MAHRGLLVREKLSSFILWLGKEGHELYTPKGDWEVLRIRTKGAWGLVFENCRTVHLSCNDEIVHLVKRFRAGTVVKVSRDTITYETECHTCGHKTFKEEVV